MFIEILTPGRRCAKPSIAQPHSGIFHNCVTQAWAQETLAEAAGTVQKTGLALKPPKIPPKIWTDDPKTATRYGPAPDP
jgi:hypothetical protein